MAARDPRALADGIERLLDDPDRKAWSMLNSAEGERMQAESYQTLLAAK